MCELNFKRLENDLEDLVTFMTDHFWEFHSNPKQTKEQIVKGFNNGWYQEDKETFWIENANKKIGLIIIHDISDTIPLFDIRLDKNVRGKGFGTKAVGWITDYIFRLPDKKIRIEAYTRSDNIAMRKTLNKCGFIKEGYLRYAWITMMAVFQIQFATQSLEMIGKIMYQLQLNYMTYLSKYICFFALQ